jgi:hypothetical protein
MFLCGAHSAYREKVMLHTKYISSEHIKIFMDYKKKDNRKEVGKLTLIN